MKIKTLLTVCSFSALFLFHLFCQTSLQKDHTTQALLRPEEAIKDFRIEEGFEVQLVTSEPVVEDPVALTFDSDGAMWVVEMRGYMHDTEGGGEDLPLGRIKILKDTNNDGTYEAASLFLDSLVLPRAICLVNDGLLVAEPPNLWFIKIEDGEPGTKTLVDSLYAEGGNVEHQPNTLFRAMDNWIYSGEGDKRYRYKNREWLIEQTNRRGQWGMSQDDYGRLFYNNNSVTLMADNFLPNTFQQNPFHRSLAKDKYSIRLVDNTVLPRVATPGVNRGYQKGVLELKSKKLTEVTSACGPVVYRGDNFPAEFYGNAFVMEPAAFLMKRIIITEDSGKVKGHFTGFKTEFLTASDERFRPVNGYTAPDGTLYFIDMHRGVIQHTTYITPYLRSYIDSLQLERPIHMGRIYRVKWKNNPVSKKPNLTTISSAQLVSLLHHPNGWVRDKAQQLLVDRQDTSVAPVLQRVAFGSSSAVERIHALWTLEGLDKLTLPVIQQAATSGERHVIQTCLKLTAQLNNHPEAFAVYQSLRRPGDRILEAQFVAGLAPFQKKYSKEANALYKEVALKKGSDPLFIDALLGNVAGNERRFEKMLSTESPSVDTTLIAALRKADDTKRKPVPEEAVHLTKAEKELYRSGKRIFQNICATCHGKEGEGIENVAPPLAGSSWVTNKNAEVPLRIVLDGMAGPITVSGKRYQLTATMPGLRNNVEMNNGSIAGIITYIRNAWGNKASAVTVEEVGKVRGATEGKTGSYTEEELKTLMH